MESESISQENITRGKLAKQQRYDNARDALWSMAMLGHDEKGQKTKVRC